VGSIHLEQKLIGLGIGATPTKYHKTKIGSYTRMKEESLAQHGYKINFGKEHGKHKLMQQKIIAKECL
jgi:hypothetical protein